MERFANMMICGSDDTPDLKHLQGLKKRAVTVKFKNYACTSSCFINTVLTSKQSFLNPYIHRERKDYMYIAIISKGISVCPVGHWPIEKRNTLL